MTCGSRMSIAFTVLPLGLGVPPILQVKKARGLSLQIAMLMLSQNFSPSQAHAPEHAHVVVSGIQIARIWCGKPRGARTISRALPPLEAQTGWSSFFFVHAANGTMLVISRSLKTFKMRVCHTLNTFGCPHPPQSTVSVLEMVSTPH